MKETIINFPKQFQEGINVAKDIKLNGPFLNITICGVGGSALPGTLLLDMNVEIPVPLYIHRDYNLPKTANENSLVLAISYSGNTEETISSYEEAKKRNLPIVGVATGGKLIEICKKDKTPFVKINPEGKIPPRSGVGYLFSAVVKVLSNLNIITDLNKDISMLHKTLKPKMLEKQGKIIAQKIKNTIPIIYASDKFKELAQIWKINFNENSKSPAFWNYFPELNHNEMEGFQEVQSPKSKIKSNFHIIILRDKKLDHQRILKRMAVTEKLLKEKRIDVNNVDIQGQNLLTKIFSAILLSLWTSYYLALEYETDPTPVKTVEEFKKKLR